MNRNSSLRLVAACALMAALGTLYAWSIFVPYLEPRYGQRAALSAIFSLAIVAFAAGMVTGPRLNHREGTSAFVIGCLAAAGLALAGSGLSYATILVGFGVLFGFANGLGYALGLRVVQAIESDRAGTLTGLVVASYMLGSIVGAPLLAASLSRHGYSTTMVILAGVLFATGAVAYGLLTSTSWVESKNAGKLPQATTPSVVDLAKLWTCFFLSSMAGVTALGHAALITLSFGGTPRHSVTAVALTALGNAVGRLAGGWMCDRLPGGIVLGGAATFIFAGMCAMAIFPTALMSLVGLATVSLGYGCIASALPSAIARTYGAQNAGRIYGILFTAWGLAGLLGPISAGWLFEQMESYRLALAAIAITALLAALAGASFRPREGGSIA